MLSQTIGVWMLVPIFEEPIGFWHFLHCHPISNESTKMTKYHHEIATSEKKKKRKLVFCFFVGEGQFTNLNQI